MTVFTRNKEHHKNLSTSVIYLAHNMVLNKATSGDTYCVNLDCVHGFLSEVQSSDNNDEIGNNQETGGKEGTSECEQSDCKQLQLSPNGMMSVPNFMKILCAGVVGQEHMKGFTVWELRI